jgi:4-alpha-glucanotransferase
MSGRVRLILALHNHQPVGNFDGVFEHAYADSYLPFLELLEEFGDVPVVLHNSGSLLEWLIANRPEYIDRLRKLVARGQVELLGGPMFEPILACIPRRDRIGQMRAYKQQLEETFQTTIRGMWVPERVWEQAFASDIAEAGLEYTLLDDTHFRHAGLTEDELHSYYLTENDGRLIKVFNGSEPLRYLIPAADPHKVIHHCRSVADRVGNAVLVFGDDGEKFGVWPGTKDLVWTRQWMRRFFQLLRENRDWLQTTTFAETVDRVSPAGRIYLPDGSYREMTEWALPTELQLQYRELRENLEHHYQWPKLKQFLRAGFWRNFLVKYPEANEMYTRMLDVSRRLDLAAQQAGGVESAELTAARLDLYRAQCNCPYWHGAFGGLYLPHLRNAIYRHLIQAENRLDDIAGRTGRWVHIEADDFNCDARKELRLASDKLIALLSPSRGGHLYELDLRPIGVNLLATLNRRREPYHEQVRQAAGQQQEPEGSILEDQQGGVKFKQPDLDRKLQYDRWARKSLVDHFLQPALEFDAFSQGVGHVGDFAEGVFQSVIRRSGTRIEGKLYRDGKLGPYSIRVTKTVSLSTDTSGTLDILYELERLPAGLPIHFGIEFNFAAMPGGASDRYFYGDDGQRLGQLDARLELAAVSRIGLVDEWLGLDVALESSQPAGLWTMPIQTVSQSEDGFELVHQSCVVVPHWEFAAPDDGRWSVRLTLSCDTSAAQAKHLAALPAKAPRVAAPV